MTRLFRRSVATRSLTRFLSKNSAHTLFDHRRARLMYELTEECYNPVLGLRREGSAVFVSFGEFELKVDLARARRELVTVSQLRLRAKLRGEDVDWLGDFAALTSGPRIGCIDKQVGFIETRKLPMPDRESRYFADRLAERTMRLDADSLRGDRTAPH